MMSVLHVYSRCPRSLTFNTICGMGWNVTQHFECHWSLRLSFDKQMSDLKAVFVRIIDVKTHPDMPKEEQDKVVDALKGEGYLIS
mmetsp:Transcript_41811/g.67265  ORF Transcript_41811/g.67265 Transcript_41811/m.67265 type:complete len:85 (-) Transcript_41811:197-451(-)